MTLIQMIGFVRLSNEREMVAMKVQSIATRMAMWGDEDGFNSFLKTLGGTDGI